MWLLKAARNEALFNCITSVSNYSKVLHACMDSTAVGIHVHSLSYHVAVVCVCDVMCVCV